MGTSAGRHIIDSAITQQRRKPFTGASARLPAIGGVEQRGDGVVAGAGTGVGRGAAAVAAVTLDAIFQRDLPSRKRLGDVRSRMPALLFRQGVLMAVGAGIGLEMSQIGVAARATILSAVMRNRENAVLKFGAGPGGGRVARGAVGAVAILVDLRRRRLGMAGGTRLRESFETLAGMAGLAHGRLVRAGKLEAGSRVVEVGEARQRYRCICPRGGRMAGGTLGAELAQMHFGFGVTGDASLGESLEALTFMTRLARGRSVHPGEFESGTRVVEVGEVRNRQVRIGPGARRVARGAVGAELTQVNLGLGMAGDAGLRKSLETVAGMASLAPGCRVDAG
jgi:hypothetical protein